MTSRSPLDHGVNKPGTPLSLDPSTLPDRLRDVGYETAAFVANPLLKTAGLDKHFDLYRETGESISVDDEIEILS